MGYNSNCYSQYCWAGCCDYWGNCPTDPIYCQYYYYDDSDTVTSSSNSSVIIVPIVVPIACFFVFALIALFVYRYWKARRMANQPQINGTTDDGHTMIIVTDPNSPAYGQAINSANNSYQNNSYNNTPTIQTYNQPVMQNQYNPVNSYPYQQPPIYSPQPAYYGNNVQQGPVIIV